MSDVQKTRTINLFDTSPLKLENVSKRMKSLFFSDSGAFSDDFSLVCEAAATHSGMLINYRIYPQDKMKKSVNSWLTPYKKPVLENHNYDSRGTLGRVFGAKYISYSPGEDVPEQHGFKADGYTQLTSRIVDPVAIKKVLDGRYLTVSVGMSTDQFLCAICGQDWSGESGRCEHQLGRYYDDKLAYGTTGILHYKDLSFVTVPADEFGTVVGKQMMPNSELKDSEVLVQLYANKTNEGLLIDMITETEINGNKPKEGDDDSLIIVIDSSKENKIKEGKEPVAKTALEKVSKEDIMQLDTVKEIVKDTRKEEQVKCLKQVDDAVKDSKQKLEDQESQLKDLEDVKKQLDECKALRQSQDQSMTVLTTANSNLEDEVKNLKEDLQKKEDDGKSALEDNIRLNIVLHKQLAERYIDLKTFLGKPDVADIKTPKERGERVKTIALRSLESLQDSIEDLLVESFAFPVVLGEVENPAITHTDGTISSTVKKVDKKDESKKETVSRMFGKSQI